MSETAPTENPNQGEDQNPSQDGNLNFSRKSIEIIAGVLIAVVSFFAGTSYQHSKQTNDIKKYTDLMNQAFGTFASGAPTSETGNSGDQTSEMNSIGQACSYDDGYSINIIKVQKYGANVRVTFQAKNAGSQNIDLSLLETYFNYGPDGIAAKSISNYGMSSNPFLEDGPLSPSMTLTRDIEFSGSGISTSGSTIQISGMQFGYDYGPCNFKVQ